jgi:heat shock protein HslJ
MKKMTNLLILMIVTLGLSCSKDDSSPIDDDNIENNDSTKIENSSFVDCDTLCMYQNIILDTCNLNSIEPNSIISKWELIAYADLLECSFITKPDDIEKIVEINFKDSENVEGNTLGNTFEGNYLIRNDSIQFVDVQISLVQEPEWGEKLTYAIYNTDIVTIQSDTLIIYYSQSKKAMIFSKQ